MRANQRGWMFRAVHGTTSSNSRSSAASGSPGASGGGPPSASRNASASTHRHRRLPVQRRPVIDDLIDHPVAEAAHLLGRQLQAHRQIVTQFAFTTP